MLKGEVARNLEQKIADEENAGARPEDRWSEAEVLVQSRPAPSPVSVSLLRFAALVMPLPRQYVTQVC
jgi:hypothetical protein